MDNYEPAKMGRPPLYDEALTQVSIAMPDEMYQWLLTQPDGAHKTFRDLVERAMSADKKPKKK